MADLLYVFVFIVSILITILFVIGTHEFAHFAAARLLGVKVLRFSIGFGKTLWRKYDKSGTEYVFALVPLGGYVKMLDENEGEVPANELHHAFNQQPYYKKFLIVLAGPAMNLLCAVLLYWLIFMIGFTTIKPIIGSVTPHSIANQGGLQANQEIISVDQHATTGWSSVLFRLLAHIGNNDMLNMSVRELKTNKMTQHVLDVANWKLDELTPDPLSSLGIKPYEPPMPLVIGSISDRSPAATSSLKLGDHIIAVDGERIHDWLHLTRIIKQHYGETLTFTIKRTGKTMKLPVTVGTEHSWLLKKSGYLGIGPAATFPPDMLREIRYTFLPALTHAFNEVVNFTYFNLILFGKLFTGKLSLQTLGGPITIFQSAGMALNYGIVPFLGFLAFLSASVGVINLIPIPGLDGGHLLFETIEFIIRRPLPQHVMVAFYYGGFAFIIFVLIQALVNDVLRLI